MRARAIADSCACSHLVRSFDASIGPAGFTGRAAIDCVATDRIL